MTIIGIILVFCFGYFGAQILFDIFFGKKK